MYLSLNSLRLVRGPASLGQPVVLVLVQFLDVAPTLIRCSLGEFSPTIIQNTCFCCTKQSLDIQHKRVRLRTYIAKTETMTSFGRCTDWSMFPVFTTDIKICPYMLLCVTTIILREREREREASAPMHAFLRTYIAKTETITSFGGRTDWSKFPVFTTEIIICPYMLLCVTTIILREKERERERQMSVQINACAGEQKWVIQDIINSLFIYCVIRKLHTVIDIL